MHTKQLFPAVCFCKDLIPDAVKCWCSLTSVKALILLLWLNTFSKKIFFAFLGFHKWSLTFLPHCHVFVLHAFSLPPPPTPPSLTPTYGWCRCYSNEWRNDNDPGNLHLHALPLIMFIVHGMSLKIKVTQIPLEESRIRPGHGEQDSSKFSAHHEKTLHTGNARLHWFYFSRSAWIDNRCLLSPSISHSSSTSPVLECSQKVS